LKIEHGALRVEVKQSGVIKIQSCRSATAQRGSGAERLIPVSFANNTKSLKSHYFCRLVQTIDTEPDAFIPKGQ